MPALLLAAPNIQFENNVSTETVARNIHDSSMRNLEWLALLPETEQECLLVGGGPSLTGDVAEIAARQKNGAYVLALNGAAKFLNTHGITPDALMVLDARAGKNEAFLDCSAKMVFLASQCDPALFTQARQSVTLFHIDTENIGYYVPGEREIQAVGGGASVGLIAMSLAYARGFRTMHLYGYDSSRQDLAHHAYVQPANDEDDVIEVTVKGRNFRAAPWMVVQVEQFQLLLPQLLELGCEISVHGSGLLPFVAWHRMLPQTPITELDKYTRMWAYPSYGHISPGEGIAALFVERCQPSGKVIDFGCGSGKGGAKIAELTDCDVRLLDFVEAGVVQDVAGHLPFIQCDLVAGTAERGDFGFCADLMEHLPPEQVSGVISNILASVPKVFFQISTVSDSYGDLIGCELHLTIQPYAWWLAALSEHGNVTWSQEGPISSMFIVERV